MPEFSEIGYNCSNLFCNMSVLNLSAAMVWMWKQNIKMWTPQSWETEFSNFKMAENFHQETKQRKHALAMARIWRNLNN